MKGSSAREAPGSSLGASGAPLGISGNSWAAQGVAQAAQIFSEPGPEYFRAAQALTQAARIFLEPDSEYFWAAQSVPSGPPGYFRSWARNISGPPGREFQARHRENSSYKKTSFFFTAAEGGLEVTRNRLHFPVRDAHPHQRPGFLRGLHPRVLQQ